MKENLLFWIFLFLSWNGYQLLAGNIKTDKFDDLDQSDPLVVIAMEMDNLDKIKCRAGYYNMTEEFTDAVYHCAGVKHTQEGRRVLGKEKVDFGGPTPFYCLRVCVFYESGGINVDRHGLNRTGMLRLFKKEMTNPGGVESAEKLTDELMECDQKHPTIFPKIYSNCTNVEDLLRCTRRVLSNCDSKDHYKKEESSDDEEKSVTDK